MPPILIILALCVVGIVARAIAAAPLRKRQTRARLRALWGTARQRKLGGQDASLYHQFKTEQEESWSLDERTWEDLYLADIFRALDHTRSRVGSQILYDLLRTPSFDAEEIERRNRLIELFTSDPELREQMQALLESLENDDAGLLPNLFFTAMPPRPAGYLLYPALTLGSLAMIVFVALDPQSWPFLTPLFITNIFVAQSYRRKIQPWIQPLRVLNTMVGVAGRLGRLCEAKADADLVAMTAPLQANREALRVLDGVTRWLLLERNSSAGSMGILVEYLNMILLLDVNSFVFSMEAVRRQQELIRTLFELTGMLDAMIAVASYRHSLPRHCVPTFMEPQKRLRIKRALHPLLPQGVANSLAVEERGVLITGSNMSGKTTFIRTVAANAVLAQTVATCLAERYEAPLLVVQTSIGRTDSLSEGKSYYMAEVETIGEFLTDAADSLPCLFVIDEIYRGTNTTERVAAAKAVLDAMNRTDGPHIVLVSTHDLELSNLLQTPWDRYHFRESVEEGELCFDYKIRAGLSSSRNALRLLAARDYPAAVVADAEATALQIEADRKLDAISPHEAGGQVALDRRKHTGYTTN